MARLLRTFPPLAAEELTAEAAAPYLLRKLEVRALLRRPALLLCTVAC